MIELKQNTAKQVQQQPSPDVVAPPNAQYLAMLGHSAFPDKTAMIIVRPHNDNVSGAKLDALIKATRQRYQKFSIIMADSLEGHLHGSRTAGKDIAAKWLVDNAQYLTDKEINAIIPWDDIAGDNAFIKKHETVKFLYNANNNARYYINMTCADRMRRLSIKKQKAGEIFDQKALMKAVLNYRIEELAGMSILRDRKDIPELCTEEFVNDDLLYDRMTAHSLKMPRIYPVTFHAVENTEPLSFED